MVPNVFPKQHHLLFGELVFPAVLVLPYVLWKGLERWQGEMQPRGENPALRVQAMCPQLSFASGGLILHFCVVTRRGWGWRIHGCDRIASAHISLENCSIEGKILFLELDISLICHHRIIDIGKDL